MIKNEDVITYSYNLIMDLEKEPMEDTAQQEESREETPMDTYIDELCAQIDVLTL